MERADILEVGADYRVAYPKICWSSIFAGAFVGVGLGFLLHLYSNAIGLSAYSATPGGASVIALGGVIGLLIGVIASFVTAGFVSGYLGRYHYSACSGGIIYGFLTWSICLVLSVLLAGSMMHYVSNAAQSLVPYGSQTPKVTITNAGANDNSPPIPTHLNTTDETAKKITPTELAWGGWLVFIMFFIGALSSCIGASMGMRCSKDHFNTLPL